MSKKKSWHEKLADSKDLPKVISSPKWDVKAGDTLVIPTPKEVGKIMKNVPKGKLITIN